MDFLKDLSNMLGGAGGQSGAGGSGLDALSQLSNMFGAGGGADTKNSAPPHSSNTGNMGAASRGPAITPGPAGGGGLGDLLGGVLGSGALTGILGALLGGKGGSDGIGTGLGALLSGGTERLEQYQQSINRNNAASNPSYGKTSAPPVVRAEQILRALIYAAKADGHIDAQEQQALQSQFSKLNLGTGGQALLNTIMAEPLDPNRIAKDVRNAGEAMQIFSLSCAAINIDQFMEKNYLEALAKALGIPDDVRDAIMSKTHP